MEKRKKQELKREEIDDLESIKESLAEEIEETITELFLTFRKDIDLRDVFIGVILHPVSRYGELELREKFKGQRMAAYRKLDQLKEMHLIKFLNVMDIRDKKLRKEKLEKDETDVLRKFDEWSKTMTEKGKKYFLSKTNYYVATEKGQDKQLLYTIMNLRKEIKQV